MILRLLLPFVAAALVSGCTPSPATSGDERVLVVFAAASLREAFMEAGRAFEASHPGVAVTFQFAGSHEIRAQLEAGARADVVATADERTMSALQSSGRITRSIVFARNTLVAVLTPEAARTVRTFEGVAEARRIVLGLPEVPIGAYAAEILERAGEPFRAAVEARVVSREHNVRQLLVKVRLGEADAAIVYRTDALTAPELATIEIPKKWAVSVRHHAAVVSDAAHRELAEEWLAALAAAPGQATLMRAGFLPAAEEP